MPPITRFGSALLLAAVLSAPLLMPARAESGFTPAPNFVWPIHQVDVAHSILSSDIVELTQPSGYPHLTIHAQTGSWLKTYQVMGIHIDMDGDGHNDLNVDYPSDATWFWDFPEPQGWYDTHNITISVDMGDNYGHGYTSTSVIPFRVSKTPTVFADESNNTLVQVRPGPCSDKIPVLVIEGFDPLNTTFPCDYDAQYGGLFDDLEANNCEVFVLNFADGGGDLRVNAPAVVNAVAAIHSLCPNHEAAVIGFSMGGVLATYALANEEAQGRSHNCGLLVCFDSPLRGANVNPDLQDEIAGVVTTNEVLTSLQARAQSMAARQMLIYDTYDRSATAYIDYHTVADYINGNGLPHNSYNAAISNGNLGPSYHDGWLTQTRHLADLTILRNGEGLPVFHITTSNTDLGPGSFTNDETMDIKGDLFSLPFIGSIDYELSINLNPIFVPTWSAFGITNAGGNVQQDATGGIIGMIRPAFDDTLTQYTPQFHSFASVASRQKILTWLHRQSTMTINYLLGEGGTTPPMQVPITVLDHHAVTISPVQVAVGGQTQKYVFDHWDDGSTENPRTFWTAHDMTRTVTMKAHLATTVSQFASGHRRVAEARQSIGSSYHAVYESQGKIWHVRNRYGAGWDDEQLLSYYPGSFGSELNPVVTTQVINGNGDQVQVHVAWMTQGGPIYYRASDVDNGATWPWAWTQQHWDQLTNPLAVVLPELKCDAPGAPNPCWPALFALEGQDDFGIDPGVYYYKQPETNAGPFLVPGTVGQVSEAEATYCGDCGYGYQVAFVMSGKMYVESFSDPNPNDTSVGPLPCSSATNLTTPGWTASSPSIVSDGSSAFVAWCESKGNARNVVFRQRVGGAWSARDYFALSSSTGGNPVLGVNSACGTLNLLWQDGGHVLRSTHAIAGGTWIGLEDNGVGGAPNLGAREYDGVAMWTSGSATPNPIQVVSPLACNISGGGGGCPFVDVKTSSGWVVDNSILARSSTGALGLDAYRLRSEVSPSAEGVALRLRENEEEFTTLERVRLVAVDHDAATMVFADGDTPLIGGKVGAARVRTAAGTDITALVDGSTPGSMGFAGNPGDTLYVELGVDGGSGPGVFSSSPKNEELRYSPNNWLTRMGISDRSHTSGANQPSIDAAWLEGTGMIAQAPDGRGGWREVAHVYPREYNSDQVVDGLGHGSYRLIFAGKHNLAFIGRVVPAAQGVMSTVIAPSLAVHSRLGDVTDAISAASKATELASGDTITLAFNVSPVPEGKVRDYLLLTNGVYTSDAPYPRIHPSPTPPPVKFSLGQNVPNPLDGRTTISFATPIASHVKIEIFDVLGRRVRTLTDQEWPAGYHQVVWDCRDSGGMQVSSGVYLYRMGSGAFAEHKRMVVVK